MTDVSDEEVVAELRAQDCPEVLELFERDTVISDQWL